MRQVLGEVTVVGQDDQPGSVGVEATDVEKALRAVLHQIAQVPAAVGVRHRRDHSAGLVEHQVDVLADRRQSPPLDPHDSVSRIDLGAQSGHDFPVDLDKSGEHQLFTLAPRGHSRLREQLLQPDESVLIGLGSIGGGMLVFLIVGFHSAPRSEAP